MKTALPIALALFASATAFAGPPPDSEKTVAPLEEERWKFMLAMPGWMAGIEGDVGLKGVTSQVDVDAYDIIRRIDMAASLRGEARKGRFGMHGDFLYLSLSDGIGSNSAVKKLDVQVDQMLGDLGMSWRLCESERGYVDVIGGARYTYLYQKLVTQANVERIGEVSTELVDDVGERVRTAVSDSGLRAFVAERIEEELVALKGRAPTLPIAPLAGRRHPVVSAIVNHIVNARRTELRDAFEARAAAATDALRAEAQARIDAIKGELSDQIATALTPKLNQRVSRTDDWIDPYVGLRARYNFTPAIYAIGRGDVGGFSVGAKFTWQVEGALGCQLTRRIFAEVGYRALGVDYEGDGLIYDVVTHGAQITMGILF